MKNLKIKLLKATRLKSELERSIEKDNLDIEEWNSIIEGNNREIDIDSIERLKDIKSEFLIELNIAIQQANFNRAKGEKYSNAYYIKKLSELQREKKHLQLIDTKDGQQQAISSNTDDSDKISSKSSKRRNIFVKYNAYLKYSDVLNRTKKIDAEIQALKNKLSNFNDKFEISIKVSDDLIPYLELVGIEK